MVALGTLMSSFWILAANSWMQTPAGYTCEMGGSSRWTGWRSYSTRPFPIASPTTSPRSTSPPASSCSVSAPTLVRRDNCTGRGAAHDAHGAGFSCRFVPLQIALGDLQGLNTREYQPAKLAAIEGRWKTVAPRRSRCSVSLTRRWQRMDDAIEVPYLGSLILTHSFDGGVQGLKEFPADQRPPVWPVFFAFRLMVGIGLAMLGMVALGWWLRLGGRLFETDWFLRVCQ